MKNKLLYILLLLFFLHACNAGKYYSKKRIHHHYELGENEIFSEPGSTVSNQKEKKVIAVSEDFSENKNQQIIYPRLKIKKSPSPVKRAVSAKKRTALKARPGIIGKVFRVKPVTNPEKGKGHWVIGLMLLVAALLLLILAIVFYVVLDILGVLLLVIFGLAVLILAIFGIVILVASVV